MSDNRINPPGRQQQEYIDQAAMLTEHKQTALFKVTKLTQKHNSTNYFYSKNYSSCSQRHKLCVTFMSEVKSEYRNLLYF